MKTKVLLSIAFIFALFVACDKKNPVTETLYPQEILISDFSLQEDCQWQGLTIKIDSVYIIRSIEDLHPFITCDTNTVSIDFNRYSLLYVRGVAMSGVSSIDKNLQQISDNKYVLNVTVAPGIIMEQWNVLLQTTKIPENAVITLNKN